jgi:hypothetical protein
VVVCESTCLRNQGPHDSHVARTDLADSVPWSGVIRIGEPSGS